MLKKIFAVGILSLAAATVYAGAPIMLDITSNVINQPFSVDDVSNKYQFTNVTGKRIQFSITVDSAAKGGVNLQCWKKHGDAKNYYAMPGETATCIVGSNRADNIRLVTKNQDVTSSGKYNITILPN